MILQFTGCKDTRGQERGKVWHDWIDPIKPKEQCYKWSQIRLRWMRKHVCLIFKCVTLLTHYLHLHSTHLQCKVVKWARARDPTQQMNIRFQIHNQICIFHQFVGIIRIFAARGSTLIGESSWGITAGRHVDSALLAVPSGHEEEHTMTMIQ